MRRPVPLFALLLVLCFSVPLAGAAKRSESTKAPAAKRMSAAVRAEQRVGREIVSLRTKTSKTFTARGGEKRVRLYPGSVHFRDAGGRWRDIDTRLQRAHGRLLNRTNSFSTSLPIELGADTVRVRKGRWWLAFALRGAHGTAAPNGSTARYADALPGVDAVYTLQRDSVKEDLVLRGPDSERRFSFDLSMARGLRPDVLRSGALALRDRRGRARLRMSAPFMVDAKRRTAPVKVRLAKTASGWRLSYRLSDAWLDRRDRAWPVVVDPVTAPNPDLDCYLDSSTPESSYCASNPMKVGMVGGRDHRIVMRFPLAGIPRGADVGGATLVGWVSGDQDASMYPDVELQPLTEPFTSAASWNRSNGADRWSEPGGETDAGARAEYPGWAENGEQYWTMLKLVREWVSGKRANHGLALSIPSGNDGMWLDSGESTASKPYLDVTIKERVGERRGWVYDRQQLSDRISLGVNVSSGNLMVKQADFSMPGGLGPAVSVSRVYNSLDDHIMSQGEWQLSTGPDFALEQVAGGSYMRVRWPSGAKVTYDRDPQTGKYTTPAGFDNTLEKDKPAAGKWQVTDHQSQTKYRFENYTKNGRLYEIEDRNGRKLTFVYNATSGNLERIEDSNNDAATTADDVRFAYTGSYITSMTDPAGRVHSYTYSGNVVTSATDPQNGASFKTLYEYNGPGSKLSKITTPQGNVTTIAYYPVGHEQEGRVRTVTRVTDTTAMTGPTTTYDYFLRRDGSGETRVTDPIGSASADENDRITRHVFDEQGRVTKAIDALGRETSQKYTKSSKVESYTAASNSGTTPNTSAKFDGDDNQIGTDTPVGSGGIKDCADFGAPDGPDERCDDPAGTYNGVSGVAGSQYLPGRATNPQGGRTEFSWQDTGGADANGNLHGVRQTTNSGTLVAGVSMNYAPTTSSVDGKGGQLSSITDGRGNATSYGYDAKGNVNLVTPPNPGAPNPTGPTRMTYNQNLARVDVVQDGKDNYRKLFYDNLDRLTKVELTGADQVLGSTEPYVQYTYDRDGNLTQEVTREQGTGALRTRTIGYDKLNRMTSESLPGGVSNTYTYDLAGNLRSLTDAGGKVEYTYNAVDEVRAVYEPGTAKPTKFEHTEDGHRSKTTYPNGVTVDQSYDGAFRLAEIHARNSGGMTLQKFNYAYRDPSTSRETPMVLAKVDGKLGQTTKYTYDGLDRLRTASIESPPGTTVATYDYRLDAAGNVAKRLVTGSQAPSSITDYGHNSFNELCAQQAGTTTSTPPACPTTLPPFTYDKNGNELTAPGRTSTYDLADHTTLLGGVAMVYLGTGQDRKTGEGTAALQHNVLGLGKRTSGTSTDYFTRDDGGMLISRRNGTARHYYLFDSLGSVTGLTDSTGAVSERYDYDPYGAPAPRAAGQWGAATGAADVANGQFGFAAGYRSVNGLYHFGQRYYDPSLMRWTQPDPLDQTGDLREGNRYVYAGADPVNHVDPLGTDLLEDIVEGVDETIDAIDRPGQLEQAWECGWNLGEEGNLDECDPWELFTGEDVEDAY